MVSGLNHTCEVRNKAHESIRLTKKRIHTIPGPNKRNLTSVNCVRRQNMSVYFNSYENV